MTTERDDFDDPSLAEMLEAWGHDVRVAGDLSASGPAAPTSGEGSRIFEPPGDLSLLRGRLEAVRREAPRDGLAPHGRLPGPLSGLRRLGIAASVLLAAGLGWMLFGPGGGPEIPVLSDLAAFPAAVPTRGAGSQEFGIHDKIALRLSSGGTGVAVIAFLGRQNILEPLLTPEGRLATLELHAGANETNVIDLNEEPDTKVTFFALASSGPLPEERVRQVCTAANGSLSPEKQTHEERRDALLAALRQTLGLAVQAVTLTFRQ